MHGVSFLSLFWIWLLLWWWRASSQERWIFPDTWRIRMTEKISICKVEKEDIPVDSFSSSSYLSCLFPDHLWNKHVKVWSEKTEEKPEHDDHMRNDYPQIRDSKLQGNLPLNIMWWFPHAVLQETSGGKEAKVMVSDVMVNDGWFESIPSLLLCFLAYLGKSSHIVICSRISGGSLCSSSMIHWQPLSQQQEQVLIVLRTYPSDVSSNCFWLQQH